MAVDISNIDIKSHNRYHIYELLWHRVSFQKSKNSGKPKGKKICGVVEKVCRNIFENAIEISINGEIFQFAEPALIIGNKELISFIYGDFDMSDITDEELFNEMRGSASYGENVDDILARTKRRVVHVVNFDIGDRVIRRGKTWRKAS